MAYSHLLYTRRKTIKDRMKQQSYIFPFTIQFFGLIHAFDRKHDFIISCNTSR